MISVRPLIRVAIFDDHVRVRQSLAHALEAVGSFDVVAQGGTAAQAIDCGRSDLPDLMIVDLHMPGSGLAALRRLYQDCPVVKCVVLSSDDSEHNISEAFAAGAFGYLIKGQPLAGAIRSMKSIAAGQSQFSAFLAAKIVAPRGVATPWPDADEYAGLPITAREEQILSRYAQGLTIDEIASSIGVSTATAGAFLTNVLHKLHEQTLLDRILAGTLTAGTLKAGATEAVTSKADNA
jgi:two-component system, NarL family, nitrate/nitrite response regulator NarL